MVKVAMVSVLRVGDVMSRNVFALSATTPIAEALEQLLGRHVGGAPVLSGRRIVGVVSKTDLFDPRREREDGISTTVVDVMTPIVYAVRESDPAMLAVQLMVDEHIHRVIVLGEAGEVAGIVTSMDILDALAHGWLPREARGGQRPAEESDLEYVDLRKLEMEGR
jgi:CBS-domain-containing membrane protein